MRILVTGANGYLGRGIVRELLKTDNEVIATDRFFEDNDLRLKNVAVDLFGVDDPFIYFGKPDVVLHLAWRDGFVHNSEAHLADLSLHYQFIEKMCKSGIKKIAVLGTMHEVGFYEGSINENTPTAPQSLYGIAKDALRNATFLICKQNNILPQWIRGFYIVGNTEYGSSIFSKIAQAEKAGKDTFPFTSGQNQWDFIDYDEFCHQVVAVVTQNEVNGIINVCSGRPEKLADRVERFIKENNYRIKLAYGTFPDRPYDSKAVWGNDAKIRRILGND